MIIEWKGKVGYGDIVSPICFAQNQHEITGEKVSLQFYWNFRQGDDPESLDNRVRAIEEQLQLDGVFIEHVYNTDLKYNHTVYNVGPKDWANQYHNVYFPKFDIQPKHTVICSPLYNEIPLDQYSHNKGWKGGISLHSWKNLVNKPGYIHIDYRTPIKDVFEALLNCRYFIGYHGSCSWVARLFGVPMRIVSSDEEFSRWAFPWTQSMSDSVDVNKANLLLEKSKVLRDEYVEGLRRTRS